MGKVGKLLPKEYKEKAIENKIPLPTVYRRLKNGWDLERAVTQQPNSKYIDQFTRTEEGELMPSMRPKTHKVYAFTAYADLEDLLNQAIEESGKLQSVFFADAIEEYLLKLWQPKTKKKNHRRSKTK